MIFAQLLDIRRAKSGDIRSRDHLSLELLVGFIARDQAVRDLLQHREAKPADLEAAQSGIVQRALGI